MVTVSDNDHVVIVGAGQAGGDLAANLREKAFSGRITLIGDEDSYPYSRPPLSKAYLLGNKIRSDLLVRSDEMYGRFDIDVKLGTRVKSIDRQRKRITFGESEHLDYDALVLATGGSPRTYPDERLNSSSNVFYMRALDQVERLRPHLTSGTRLTVIGGGYIGLEVAAVARTLGVAVTVIEREQRLLARVTSPVMSSFFDRIHREEGVALHTGRSVSGFDFSPDRELSRVVLDDGTIIETDVCLIGIGLQPNTALAEAAGVEVNDGIIVDSLLQTSDPSIFAVGDVARYPCSESGGTRRLESIPNSTEQARALAQTLVGNPAPYNAIPWFWSDQYELKLQVVGLISPSDAVVVRGDPQHDRSISVFYIRNDEVRAADVVSNPREFAMARKLVTKRAVVDPAKLGDASFPLKDLLPVVNSSFSVGGMPAYHH
ncbi:probable ferredoxin--NAD(+) reductase (plasmid) [Rhodococcus jostii RHA1]|uniref:Probable ferredoxin--NAD(+) reductase n=1 Tax=Rhodococcus jostii (strain RHA1) TaxID=101510 RepID=Q0RVH2_RHOJR|nr:probable ferredoxin--NAD(+) reductase [Rhodococcus jostii RHA1]